MPKVVAILLAAGESRRMGQLKALLPWQGTSLLQHQVAALRNGGVERVMVVLGHQADRLHPLIDREDGVNWVLNPNYLQGKTTSIKAGKAGLENLSSDQPTTLLILNVDQPRNAETISFLLEAHHAGDALITIPTYQGKGGHPIIVDGWLFDELAEIDEETQGMKALVQRHVERTQRVETGEPAVLWDLNTPEQYQAALEG